MKTNRKTNGKVEILIAEDSPTQAAQLAHLLEEHGYSVTAAANGREALALLERRRPTLVISDIVMPELDGYGLCRAIKADKKLKDIPVMLVTTLSDPQDVIRGLECGADNFLRKPYDERHLLSRIDYLLMNLELRKDQKMQMGMEINLGGQKHFISSDRQQILDLLISTFEQAVEINSELKLQEKELAHSNEVLNALYRIAEGLNQAGSERQVLEMALERALELPGIQAGWISLWEGESGFRLAAAHNLPPALEAAGAMEGDCACRRRLISGELDHVTNIMECERLGKAKGDTRGLRYHASVPLWLGDRTLGVMNLVGPDKGLFNDDELRVLYGIGNQVAVALERAHLHEHLEGLVQERTAALEAEIVERKRIEKEQARLVAIIEATPDMVATGDPNGHVLYYNRAGLRMLGFEPGLDPSTVRFRDTHPDWAAKLVMEEGIPHAIEHGTWSGETALLGRDGREVPISQVIIAHKGPDGSVEYLSTIARDITERKQAVQELRESEVRFRSLTEMSSDFYWESDTEHRLTARGSAGKASGVSMFQRGAQIGERRWEIPYLLPDEAGWQAHRAVLDAHRPFRDFDLSRLGADGTERYISISGDPVFDESGTFRGYRGVGTDITARKRAEEALQQEHASLLKSQQELFDAHESLAEADRLESVGRLAAGVAHEVKNPLGIIRLGTDYLAKQFSQESNQEVVDDIRTAIDRAEHVITDLLDFSRQKPFAPRPTNINEVIDNAINLIKHEIKRRNIVIIRNRDDPMPPIYADPDRLVQVFINLLSNAAQAIGGDGSIEIVTRSIRLGERDLEQAETSMLRIGEPVVTVDIRDSGPGISAEHEKKLFKPFFTTKPVGEGTGLGLAVSRSIVILHRGSLSISNRPEGGASALLMFRVAGEHLTDEKANTGSR